MFAGLLGSAGCSLAPADGHWREQLQPGGPCWSLNLADGFESPAEVDLLLDCLDQSGDFAPLRRLVAALEGEAADGSRNWSQVEALAAAAPNADLSLGAWISPLLRLLDGDDGIFRDLLEVGVELIYGRPFGAVAAGELELADPAALQAGLLAPLYSPLNAVVVAILDDGPAIPALLGDALDSARGRDALCTLVGIARSTDPDIGPLAQGAMTALGEAIAFTRDAGNDRWTGASGDSLRDLVDALVFAQDRANGRSWLDSGAGDLGALLGDRSLQGRLELTLLDLAEGGHIGPLFQQLRTLAEVDALGTSLDLPPTDAPPGARVSALSSFLRMIDTASRPVSCGFLGLEFDNLSVTLLQLMADLDPDTVRVGVSILGPLLDSWFGGATLDIVEAVCDGVTEELVWDLHSVDRFNDEETGDLLVILLQVLAAASPDDGSVDRTPELVGLLSLAWRADLAPPVEELLRDVGNTALADDVAAVIPLVVDPSPLAVADCPSGSAPLDFPALWELAALALVGEEGASAALDRLRPAVEPLVASDEVWLLVGRLGALLREDAARLRGAPELGARLVAADPDLAIFDDLAGLMRDPALVQPSLKLLGSPAFADALQETALDAPGPVPWLSGLILDDSLERVLRTVKLVVDWARGLDGDPD